MGAFNPVSNRRSPGHLRFRCCTMGRRQNSERPRQSANGSRPSAEISAANFLFNKPAKTMTATSRVRGGDAQASDDLLSMAMRLIVGGEEASAAVHNEYFVTLLRERRACRARERTVASSSEYAPANLITILIE